MKSYLYVDGEYQIKYEIKRSVFIATVKGEVDKDGADEFVRSVKKRYPDATHNCYAYIADELGNCAKFSDDGEPGGTAGQPIYDVIKKNGLKKTAIVVTRYFGGIKLGANGLVGAYSKAAADAVKASVIAEKTECIVMQVEVGYNFSAQLEKYLRSNDCHVKSINYERGIKAEIFVPDDRADEFAKRIEELTSGSAVVAATGRREFVKLG